MARSPWNGEDLRDLGPKDLRDLGPECTMVSQWHCDVCDREWTETLQVLCDIFDEMPPEGATVTWDVELARCPECVRMMGEDDQDDDEDDEENDEEDDEEAGPEP